jgi:hypothetical protein
MKKYLISIGLAALAVFIALQAYHFNVQQELKKEIGRGYQTNMVNLSIAFKDLEYDVLDNIKAENKKYDSLKKLQFMLMYLDIPSFKGQPEIRSLLSDVSGLLSEYEINGELAAEQQEAFDSKIRKVRFIIMDLEDILGSEIDWYYAFIEPNEKLQKRVQERLVMEF